MTTIDLALLIVRIVLGVIFIIHGGQKLFSWYSGPGIKGVSQWLTSFEVAHPTPLAWMVALSEFGGGLLVLLGLLTPLGAAITISVMLVAIVQVHAKNGFLNTNQGYEFNLSLIALALVLLLVGAGTVSMDHLLGLARPLGQWPTWVAVVLLLIPFGGVIVTELSRTAKAAPGVNAERTTMRRR
jgi:putative oxidoreductase